MSKDAHDHPADPEERVRLRSGERRSVALHTRRAIMTGRVMDDSGRGRALVSTARCSEAERKTTRQPLESKATVGSAKHREMQLQWRLDTDERPIAETRVTLIVPGEHANGSRQGREWIAAYAVVW